LYRVAVEFPVLLTMVAMPHLPAAFLAGVFLFVVHAVFSVMLPDMAALTFMFVGVSLVV
jgi:hypothetical protein